MAKQDYYEILGVAKSTSDSEIKSAYRKLARKHHPDIDKSAGAAEKFKEISEAYQVLTDPQKRRMYDQFGHSAFQSGGAGAGGFNPFGGGFKTYGHSNSGPNVQFDFGGFEDPFELFEQIFGMGGFGNAFRRRPTYQMEVSFEDVLHGSTREIEVKDASGKNRRITIKVPAGVDNGTRMRFGEIDIIFRVPRPPNFVREGADIFSQISLPVPQLVLGVVVEVATVWGKVNLKIPAGADPGSLVRIKEKGAPKINGGRGDHYVRVKVEIPKKLSAEERQLYERLANFKAQKKGWF